MKKNTYYLPLFGVIAAVMLGLLFFLGFNGEEEITYEPAFVQTTRQTKATTTAIVTEVETSKRAETEAQTTTVLQQATTKVAEHITEVPSNTEILLSYGKGNTYFSAAAENKFISYISAERGISPSFLVAVYSLPDEGLNYVLEFSGEEKSYDTLRRVYLINESGNIESVAASNSDECENISAAENAVCMKVLIKQGIFPCIEDLL